MKRIITLLLAIVLLFTSTLSLFSCVPEPQNPTPDDKGNENENEIITPPFKEYSDRNTIHFSEIVYARPDVDKIIERFASVTKSVSGELLTFEEKLIEIVSLEAPYANLYTMLTYAKIKESEDRTNEYWSGEYAYISEKYPEFAQTLEALFVAAATSIDAERFEEEYFGDGFVAKYSGGATITDELVALITRETELENEYSALSPKTVQTEYGGIVDTCDSHLKRIEELYGKGSVAFTKAEAKITSLYEKARSEKSVEIYLDLLKVRREIADNKGLESYVPYAYETLGHDYSEEKLLTFICEIAKYIVPVWATLEAYVFSTENLYTDTPLDKATLINGLYSVYQKMDDGLFDAYSYMLQYGLYNVSPLSEGRFDGSFASYFNAYDAPYLFVTTEGTAMDFTSLSHEFGHFYDSFVNRGSDAGVDLAEVSSTALEFLTFLNLDDMLGSDSRQIHFSLVRDALNTLVFQSFYALFEHNVYSLKKEEINERHVTEAMYRAAESIGLNTNALTPSPEDGIYSALDFVLVPHMFLSPMYVESYCTSVTVSLEIYFLEKNDTGAGVDAYISLIDRRESPLGFEDYIEDGGLKSPFSTDVVRELAYMLYYDILGDYRYDENTGVSTSKRMDYAA